MVLSCSKQNRTKTNAILLSHYGTATGLCVVARGPGQNKNQYKRERREGHEREGKETRVLQRVWESHLQTYSVKTLHP